MPVEQETGPQEATARLRISEIFCSIQGEALSAGCRTTFVRLTGCPLRCVYCDTAYAFQGGAWHTLDEIAASVREFGARFVCVTGGEPLAQRRCLALLERLCDEGYDVSLETSGALDIQFVDSRVSRVVDIKTPGSAEEARNLYGNVGLLTKRDALKFVICDDADYEWAKSQLEGWGELPCDVLFAPSYGEVDATALAEWILRDGLDVRLQLQLHKLLWGDVAGR